MRDANTPTLILGWGNAGRLDDGLGPAFADRMRSIGIDGVTAEDDYQLQIEHAAELARYRRVVLADADRSGPEPFAIRRLEPSAGALRYTSHEMSPAGVLALCEELSGARPEVWLLGIRGYEFDDFGERLSDPAQANLERAVAYVHDALRGAGLEEYPEVKP